MFGEPLERAILGVKAFLEGAVLRVCGVLVVGLGEEGGKSHGAEGDDIEGMVDARFELRDGQVFGDVVRYVAIDVGLTDSVRGD